MTALTAVADLDRELAGRSGEPSGPRLDKTRFQWSTSVLVLPAGILIAAVFVYGVAYSIYVGFTNLSLLGPTATNYKFTGLQNLKFMYHDPIFFRSVRETFIFIVGSGVIGSTVLGLAMAVLMKRTLIGLRFLAGGAAMVAFMLPPVTIAILWYAASVSGGTFATLSGNSKSDPLFAAPLLVVSLANAWSLAGLSMLLFGAALRNIPADINEAASLEGVGGIRRFVSITLPLLKPTIITNALLMTLLSLGNFAIVYIMTQGGPQNATMILPVYSYQQGFNFDRLGYGALIGNVTVILSAILGYGYVRLSSDRPSRRKARR